MNEQSLPHHKLVAYQLSLEFLRRVHEAAIRDADQRAQARKSAKSAARNIAEAAGRWSRADKARVFAIARGEVCEAFRGRYERWARCRRGGLRGTPQGRA